MKFKIFMMLCILGVLSVTPMIYMGKFNPLEFFDSSISKGATEFSKLKVTAPKNLSSVVTDQKVQVYKWRDENGVMQFSNTPPVDGAKSEKIEVNPNKNLMKAVKVPAQEEKQQEVAKVEKPGPYSVKGMKSVMDDAKGIEELLQKRDEERHEMIRDF